MRISDWNSDVCSSDLVFRRSHHTPRRDGIGSSTTGGGCAPLPVQRDQRPSATVQNDFPFGHAFGTHRQYGLQCLQQRSLVAVVEHTAHAQVVEGRSEEHPSEIQSLMRTSYAVFWL